MTHLIPRLPVLDWDTFAGPNVSDTPCLLTHPRLQFTQSGRASILLALEMLEIGAGDKVLVPTYHCPTMVAPIVARGAQAIFYPVDARGSPQLPWIRQANTQGIRAIVVAHFFGIPQPLADMRRWCDQQKVFLIEDCAHGLFGISGDRALGRWGDLAIASLTKFFPVPEGGCLINNTVPAAPAQLSQPKAMCQVKAGFDIIHAGVNHDRLKGLTTLVKGLLGLMGRFKKKNHLQEPSEDVLPMDGFTIDTAKSHQALTYASRWTTRYVPRARIVAQRRLHFLFLSQALSGLPGIRPLRSQLPEHCAPYVFPLWVDDPDPGYAQLRQLAFPVSRWDRLWPTVSTLKEDSGVQWSHHVLQLACHQDLTPEELQQMVDTVKRIFLPKKAISVLHDVKPIWHPTRWHDAPTVH